MAVKWLTYWLGKRISELSLLPSSLTVSLSLSLSNLQLSLSPQKECVFRYLSNKQPTNYVRINKLVLGGSSSFFALSARKEGSPPLPHSYVLFSEVIHTRSLSVHHYSDKNLGLETAQDSLTYFPTEHFTILQSRNPSNDVSELNIVYTPTDFRASPKLWNAMSGYSQYSPFFYPNDVKTDRAEREWECQNDKFCAIFVPRGRARSSGIFTFKKVHSGIF